MAGKYHNRSAGILEFGGVSYAPGAEMPLDAEARKDPTVDWWIRSGFVSEGAPGLFTAQPAYIPTVGDAGPIQMQEAPAPEAPKKG